MKNLFDCIDFTILDKQYGKQKRKILPYNKRVMFHGTPIVSRKKRGVQVMELVKRYFDLHGTLSGFVVMSNNT